MQTFCPGRFRFRALGTACLFFAQVLSAQQAPAPQDAHAKESHTPPNPEQGPQLEGERVTIPIVVIDGFVFIQGAVNGHAGDIMFDTGIESPFFLNTRAVMPPNGRTIGHGVFSSGQTYDVAQYPLVDRLDLPNGLHFEKLAYTLGYPGDVIQSGVDPKYIGSLGVGFFHGYVYKLDYTARSIAFFRNDPTDEGEKQAEKGEKVLQTISFDSQWHVPATISGMQFTAGLDTGSHCGLTLSSQQIATMEKAGSLRKQSEDSYILSGLVIEGKRVGPMHIEVTVAERSRTENPLLPNQPAITLGYEFFSQYKTVRDYEGKTLTLLEPTSRPVGSH